MQRLTQLPPQLFHRVFGTAPQLGAEMRRFNRAVFAADDADDLLRATLAEDILRIRKSRWRQFLLTADARFEFRQIAIPFWLTGHCTPFSS